MTTPSGPSSSEPPEQGSAAEQTAIASVAGMLASLGASAATYGTGEAVYAAIMALLTGWGLDRGAASQLLEQDRNHPAPNVIPLFPTSRATSSDNLEARATYIVRAARRLWLAGATSLASGDSEAIKKAFSKEARYLKQHLTASTTRRLAAQAIDGARNSYGPLLGWYAKDDERTTPACRVANGHNFTLEDPPKIGLPGMLHAGNCRCRPGRPFAGAMTVNEALGLQGQPIAASEVEVTRRIDLAAWDAAAHPIAPAGASGGTGGQFVPVGQARNSQAAGAQKSATAQADYKSFMKMGPAQRKAFVAGLKPDSRLEALSALIYSFKTSDPSVVSGRVAIANQLAARNLDVKKFGALGGGITPKAAPKKAVAKPAAKKPAAKKTALPKPKNGRIVLDDSVSDAQIATLKKAGWLPKKDDNAEALYPPGTPGTVKLSASERNAIELAFKFRHGWIPILGAPSDSRPDRPAKSGKVSAFNPAAQIHDSHFEDVKAGDYVKSGGIAPKAKEITEKHTAADGSNYLGLGDGSWQPADGVVTTYSKKDIEQGVDTSPEAVTRRRQTGRAEQMEAMAAQADMRSQPLRAAQLRAAAAEARKSLELSAQTGMLAATPAPRGKPGGPGLFGEKGNKLPNYIEQVVKGLIDGGMPSARAYPVAIGKIRDWAEGKGNVKPEVRAASASAIAEWDAKRAKARIVNMALADGAYEKAEWIESSNVVELAMAAQAAETVELAWSEFLHPRGFGGKFKGKGDLSPFSTGIEGGEKSGPGEVSRFANGGVNSPLTGSTFGSGPKLGSGSKLAIVPGSVGSLGYPTSTPAMKAVLRERIEMADQSLPKGATVHIYSHRAQAFMLAAITAVTLGHDTGEALGIEHEGKPTDMVEVSAKAPNFRSGILDNGYASLSKES